MADSRLVQFLSAGEGTNTMNRRETETFISAEAIAVGSWVGFDASAAADGNTTLTLLLADGNSAPVVTPFGVALTAAAAAGEQVKVCTSGPCYAKTLDAAGAGMAIGALLQISNTAGTADLAAAASTQPVCGILAETIAAAAGAGTRRVIVRKSF